MSQISQIKKIYHAAIYVRLSKEDGAVASHEKTESNSIANQKSLIRDFLENKNDIEVVQEYVDDGFSGSNFERPAFQMMLEDIKKGKIDCVVTKDLSRFGREYIDSGMYIEILWTRTQKADHETGLLTTKQAEYPALSLCRIFSLFCCPGFPKGLAPWHTTLLAKCSVLYALLALLRK